MTGIVKEKNMNKENYDLIIIGGGPAGLTAGIYASRARLNTLLMEKLMPGGQVLLTDVIENFPGFSKPIKGPELVDKMVEQAKGSGLKIANVDVKKISKERDGIHGFRVECASGEKYKTSSVIIATGATWKHLGVPGEDRLKGCGVSYCGTCDGPLFKGRDLVVVGGGDKALEESLYLAKIANSIKLIHRRGQFRAVKELQERILANKIIQPVYDSVVTEIGGKKSVEFVKIANKKTKKVDVLPCGAVFIFIGIKPNTGFLKSVVSMDEKGFILTDSNMKTSLNGIYACGDAIKKNLYQIVTATGEGATAAFNAERFVEELKNK